MRHWHRFGSQVRPLAPLRTAFGLLLLLAPHLVLGVGRARRVDNWALGYCRLLGLRHLAEALLLRRHHDRRWGLAGATVDAIHAASAVLIALVRPGRRRMALLNAVTATAFAVEGYQHAGHDQDDGTGDSQRWSER